MFIVSILLVGFLLTWALMSWKMGVSGKTTASSMAVSVVAAGMGFAFAVLLAGCGSVEDIPVQKRVDGRPSGVPSVWELPANLAKSAYVYSTDGRFGQPQYDQVNGVVEVKTWQRVKCTNVDMKFVGDTLYAKFDMKRSLDTDERAIFVGVPVNASDTWVVYVSEDNKETWTRKLSEITAVRGSIPKGSNIFFTAAAGGQTPDGRELSEGRKFQGDAATDIKLR